MKPENRDAGHTYEVSYPPDAHDAALCQVDANVYHGWFAFQAHCFQCHGASGMGTTFAPSVPDRFNTRVGYARFNYVLHHGYHGSVGAMPSFDKQDAVLKVLDSLYVYLRARAAGALPPGRPPEPKS